MKGIIIAGAFLIAASASFGQFSIGIQGTGSLSDADIKMEDGLNLKKKMRAMPGAGVVVQYGFSERFAIRSGINYQQNGITVDGSGPIIEDGEFGEISIEAKTNLHYVQVPVYAMYTHPGRSVQLFAGAGGYYNYGVSGTSKLTASYSLPGGGKETVELESDAFKSEADGGAGLKRSDYGLAAIAGARFSNGMFANIGYQYSLSDIDPSADGTYKNRALQLTIGYFFRGR